MSTAERSDLLNSRCERRLPGSSSSSSSSFTMQSSIPSSRIESSGENVNLNRILRRIIKKPGCPLLLCQPPATDVLQRSHETASGSGKSVFDALFPVVPPRQRTPTKDNFAMVCCNGALISHLWHSSGNHVSSFWDPALMTIFSFLSRQTAVGAGADTITRISHRNAGSPTAVKRKRARRLYPKERNHQLRAGMPGRVNNYHVVPIIGLLGTETFLIQQRVEWEEQPKSGNF